MGRLLRMLLVDARDWIFGIAGVIGVIALPMFDGNWLLVVPAVAIYAALYILAVFATSRWLGESRERDADT